MSFVKSLKIQLIVALLILSLLIVIGVGISNSDRAAAQDGVQASATPSMVVNRAEPSQITVGGAQPAYMSIFGSGFTASTTVQLMGYGNLPTQLIDNGSLVVSFPGNINPGQYVIQILDPVGGIVTWPTPLTIQVAPTPTSTNTPPQPIFVTRAEPSQVMAGQGGTLSVIGGNFTNTTVIRLVGVGLLTTTFINSGALTAQLPTSLLPGVYNVEVSDPLGGTQYAPNALTVIPVPPTAAPTNTPAPPTPTLEPSATPQPATPIPGQPSLLARNFSVSPATIAPGGTVTLNFEVVNQGNRAAQGVSVAVDSGGKFVPANGQATATLPDIPVGGRVNVTLMAVAAMDTPAGPISIPVTMAYRDFSGENYTSKASLSVNVEEAGESSQVVMSSYNAEPNPVEPGKSVIMAVHITNSGNKKALQVLLRVSGSENVLLAGPNGDSFPIGDLDAGESVELELPLVVRPDAKSGPQSQPFTITYLQDGEAQQAAGSMTVEVRPVLATVPLMLLESYDYGKDILEPGEQFTLNLDLKNVGNGDATELVVVFGTVESSGDSGGGTPTSGGGTTTTPSTTFAPVGSGGTQYIGTVEANGEGKAISQEFIVNGTTTSGVYSLPVTVRYKKPDGTTAQDNLRAIVVVVAPPNLNITLQSPVPEQVNVGEPLPIGLTIKNLGTKVVNFTNVTFEAENADVMDVAEVFIGPVKGDEETTFGSAFAPSSEGHVKITVTIYYLNDLNQEVSIVQTYETEAVTPPPPPDDNGGFPIDPTPEPEQEEEDASLGDVILGFLGLGS
ncbi:MAG: hypothetical protein BroJett018_22650 [Chloroflexota bacterium]|nr:hypothetical protein [Chloroflexota bacterium]NOG63213.1 hypothetical protein [Chloroflexota bacterium]GIK64471.1 MAG: hypothetical protein BroJett018_22650 [Chloroflexota bacterium]